MRQHPSKIEEQKRHDLVEKIASKSADGLEVKEVEGKGKGVFANRKFARKEFVTEYQGELISTEEAEKREVRYGDEPHKFGSFMYYFYSPFHGKRYCVDATTNDGSMGRLLNHSLAGNVECKVDNI